MSKAKLYRITIKVHPAVWRYIDNNYPVKMGAYDLSRSVYYYLVTAMLYQSRVRMPSQLCRKYGEYRPVTVMITEFDFYHYGFQSSELQQCRLSRNILHLIVDDACRRIAQARVVFGVPVTTAIDHYLIDNGYEEGELDAEYLRSVYKRKYRGYEQELETWFRNAVTDWGYNDEKFEKKHVGIFPNHFKA